MGVTLTKGGRVSLTKDNPGLKKIVVGLGWDVNAFDGNDFDLDASAFLLGSNKKCPSDEEFIFYGHKEHPSGAVIHSGDNRTGDGEGDDETLNVDLSKVPANIQSVVFSVTIYNAEALRQNFGQVDNAYIRIFNEDTGEELTKYDLTEDFSVETAIVAGELYRKDGGWSFRAVGSGFTGGLAALCGNYGIEVE